MIWLVGIRVKRHNKDVNAAAFLLAALTQNAPVAAGVRSK